MSHNRTTTLLVLAFLLLASCGGGGSDNAAPGTGGVGGGTGGGGSGGGGTGGGTTTSPLDPATAELRRHYDVDWDFTVLFPTEWERTLGRGNQGDVVVSFLQFPIRTNDPYQEYLEVSVAPVGTLLRRQSITNIQDIETNQISIRDLNAEEKIFDGDLAGEPTLLRFLETTFDIDELSFSIIFYGERGDIAREDDGFDDHLPLMRHITQQFAAGIRAIENDPLLDPGRPAVGTDGSNFLTVACRDASRQAFFSGSIVGVMFQPGNTRLGDEFEIDNQSIPCAELSPSVSWDGSNYLVTYIREMSFPLIRNGQTVQNDQLTVVGKRISQSGVVLDSDPIVISTEGTDQATNVFKYKAASDASGIFDGVRHIVVWEQVMDSDVFDADHFRQIHGAFVDTNGVVSDNFVVFDGINGLYETFNYAHWRPDVAAGQDRIMVVLGPRGQPSTKGDPSPIYAQFVDFTGSSMLSVPLLVREDNNDKRPRYPQVAFDGENFVVSWIQGSKSTSSIGDGFFGIFARKVAPGGMLLNGDAQSDGFEIMPEVEQNKEFLEMRPAGTGMVVMWGQIGGAIEPGVWSRTFETDLSAVGAANPVWGDRIDFAGNVSPAPEFLAFANGSTTGAVVWTTYNIVRAWFLE